MENPYVVELDNSEFPEEDNEVPTATITSTNNQASSQTVTLTMTDDTGVSGYYFGTSSSPNNLDYTNIISVTSTTITKTVDDGTYYLFVKDVAGNIYNTSVDFYKVILDANSGSVSPTSIVAKSGNTINLPTPTGGSFIEWNTALDESGTSYITSYIGSGTGSITLYAVDSDHYEPIEVEKPEIGDDPIEDEIPEI